MFSKVNFTELFDKEKVFAEFSIQSVFDPDEFETMGTIYYMLRKYLSQS